jgi:hypothetical protein
LGGGAWLRAHCATPAPNEQSVHKALIVIDESSGTNVFGPDYFAKPVRLSTSTLLIVENDKKAYKELRGSVNISLRMQQEHVRGGLLSHPSLATVAMKSALLLLSDHEPQMGGSSATHSGVVATEGAPPIPEPPPVDDLSASLTGIAQVAPYAARSNVIHPDPTIAQQASEDAPVQPVDGTETCDPARGGKVDE